MSRSPARLAAALLLAALAAAPRASALSRAFEAERAALLTDRDPAAADKYLGDQALQSRLTGEDPSKALELFRAAAELADMRQLLKGFEWNTRVIRSGLAARPGCAFCQDPKALLAWAARYHAAPEALLREAVYEWDAISPARAAWLKTEGVARPRWEAMSFVERHALMRRLAKAPYDALMKAVPNNQSELEALQAGVESVEDVLDHDAASVLEERTAKAEAAVNGLAKAGREPAVAADPGLKAALAAARAAPDLETRLSNLSRIFDGLNIPDPILRSAAPLKPGQGFDPATRRLTAEILGPALLSETGGTWAGDELKAFYAKVPLKITLKTEDAGSLATYSEGAMNFDAASIENFLKARGRPARDLLTDAPLLHELVRELAPVFVHEATHHRQDVWAAEKHIAGTWSQDQEIEAMETESVYLLEKMARDPAYKAYLVTSAESSPNAREALGLASQLETDGVDRFKRSIRAQYYPELLSLEGEVWSRLVRRDGADRYVRAELARRAALPAKERARRMEGPGLDEEYDDRSQFYAAVAKAGTAALESFLTADAAKSYVEPADYAVNRARLDEVNRRTEERLREFRSAPVPSASRRPDVPFPGKRGPS